MGVLPSIEMVVWVAAGGRGTLVGAIVGAFGVNWIQSWLTTSYPDLWLLFLGALFMSVVLFFPDGVVGAAARLVDTLKRLAPSRAPQPLVGPNNLDVVASGSGRPRSEPTSPTPLQ
jgi:urea transport system permease protein